MRQADLQRRLSAVADEMRRLREDLRVADEQLAHHRAVTDEAETRALVEGSPLARRAHALAAGDRRRAERDHEALRAGLAALVQEQDALLDEMAARPAEPSGSSRSDGTP